MANKQKGIFFQFLKRSSLPANNGSIFSPNKAIPESPLYGVYVSSLTHWSDYCENEQNNELVQPKSLESNQMPIQPIGRYSIAPLKT